MTMKREEKILFRDLTDKEKSIIVKVWERVSVTDVTDHAREKMELLGITKEDIEQTIKRSDIIEYKVVNGNKYDDVRILVRGRDVVQKRYEWTRDKDRQMRAKSDCNICLVISLTQQKIVTTYTSQSNNDRYKNSKKRRDVAYRLFLTSRLEKGLKLLATS